MAYEDIPEGQLEGVEDVSKYPELEDVLRAVLQDQEVLATPVQRLEVNLFASGEATYRLWQPGGEEYQGGYLTFG